MQYKELKPPREQDQVIMEIFMANRIDQGTLRGLSWCRGYLGAIFLSDISTADSRYSEQYVLSPRESDVRSEYKFLREKPTARDWKE